MKKLILSFLFVWLAAVAPTSLTAQTAPATPLATSSGSLVAVGAGYANIPGQSKTEGILIGAHLTDSANFAYGVVKQRVSGSTVSAGVGKLLLNNWHGFSFGTLGDIGAALTGSTSVGAFNGGIVVLKDISKKIPITGASIMFTAMASKQAGVPLQPELTLTFAIRK